MLVGLKSHMASKMINLIACVSALLQNNKCYIQIGMVAWKMTFFTPEYPNGRDIILICNDITYKIGTFAPQEDILFLVIKSMILKNIYFINLLYLESF